MMRKRSSGSTLPSLSFLHWSGPQFDVPAGAKRNSEIVFLVRFQNRVGRLSASAAAAVAVRAIRRTRRERPLTISSFIRPNLRGGGALCLFPWQRHRDDNPFTPVRDALVKFAPVVLASVRLASVRSAPARSASDRSAPEKLAP